MITNQCTNEETNKVFDGINILLKYYPNANIRADYREIYFGDSLEDDIADYCDDTNSYSYYLSKFSGEDLGRLEKLDWYISKNNHRWTIDT
jgi:hypothetical protein